MHRARKDAIEKGLRRGLDWIEHDYMPHAEPYMVVSISVRDLLPDVSNAEIALLIAELAATELVNDTGERSFSAFMSTVPPTEY